VRGKYSPTGEVTRDEGAARRGVKDAGTERSDGEDIIDGLHSRLPLDEAGAHHAVGGESDVGLRGVAECVGAQVGEDGAGGDVGEGVDDVPWSDGERLVDAVSARGKDDLANSLFDPLDFLVHGIVAGHAVVHRMQLVGFDGKLATIEGNHEFSEVLAILPGLNDRSVTIDDDRLVQLGMAVGADDNINARHGLG